MDDELNMEMKTLVLDELAKFKEKLQKIETQMNKVQKENQVLTAKVNSLETIIEKLTNTNIKDKPITKTNHNEQEETWLYYIPKGIQVSKISNKLELNNDAQILEMNIDNWEQENEMLKNILHKLGSIHDFTQDYSSSSIKELKSIVMKILSEILSLDLVFILRNLPKKKSNTYDQIMSNIATFSGILYNTYEELQDNNEALGKIALVLESEEDLQILNVLKNNTRMILFVEQLFKD